MMFSRLIRTAALACISLGLSGCFTSEQPLVSAGDADFPFESLTYHQADSEDRVTLLRVSDGYRPASEADADDRVLLKAVGEGLYVAQVRAPGSDEGRYLYGLIRVANDRMSFVMTASEASETDLAAVRAGVAGLFICKDDRHLVCVDDLVGYADYAQTEGAGKTSQKYDVLNVE